MVGSWSSVVAVVALFLGPGGLQPAPPCLLPPVVAPVIDPFREPGCSWCPGNRGVTYDVAAGTVVRAAAAGTVSFSGAVAGTRYVVVEHAAGGLRATYGGLASTPLVSGDVVTAGGLVGRAGGALHFGLRAGDVYVDPGPLLGRVVVHPRLVPTDGTERRPGPAPRVDCPDDGADAGGDGESGVDGARPVGDGGGAASRVPARPAAGDGTAPGRAALPLRGLPASAWQVDHHDGPAIDVIVPVGTPVYVWHGGTVRGTHTNGRNCAATGSRTCPQPCGIGVTVVDASWPDVTWTYCHLSSRDVGVGDVLVPGQPVGRSGHTGRSGVPHLHLEVRVGGRRVCPQAALASIAATGRMPDPHELPTSGCSP